MGVDPPSPDEVRGALRTVLERPDFATAEPFWLLRILGEAWAALRRWLFDAVEDLLGLQDLDPVLFWLIVGWLVLSLIALTGHLAWMGFTAVRRGGGGGGRKSRRAAPPSTPDAEWWEAESRRRAAEGLFRDAVVALYRAVLLRIAGRGHVRFDESRTPGEYLRELEGSGLRSALEPIFHRFVVLAYGRSPVGESEYRRFVEHAAEATGRG